MTLPTPPSEARSSATRRTILPLCLLGLPVLAAVALLLLVRESLRPDPIFVSIRLLSLTNDPKGLPVGFFVISNAGRSTVLVDACVATIEPGRAKPLYGLTEVSVLEPGKQELWEVEGPTNQAPWELAAHVSKIETGLNRFARTCLSFLRQQGLLRNYQAPPTSAVVTSERIEP